MTDQSPPPGLEELMRLHEAVVSAYDIYACVRGLRATGHEQKRREEYHAARDAFRAALTRAFTPVTAVSAPGAGAYTMYYGLLPVTNTKLPEGTRRFSSVGQLWEVRGGQWQRVPPGDGPEAQPLSAPSCESGPGNTIEAAPERAETHGHDEPCYYCGRPINSLAGDPSEWGVVGLCHEDDPGVNERLAALTLARQRIAELKAPLPEGEVRGLVEQLRFDAKSYRHIDSWPHKTLADAADALEHQARALAEATALVKRYDG